MNADQPPPPPPPPAAVHSAAAHDVTHAHVFVVPAEPTRVFPLLCPVRERDWIPGWRATMLHSTRGVAEADCIFRTEVPHAGSMTWVVSRYEPPHSIEFTCFIPDRAVMRLKIVLTTVAGGTRLEWTRRWLATGPVDASFLELTSPAAADARMATLERLLVHYLRTGTMLRPDDRR